jgi:glycosyltransferase involved in cell wall biosynthesis
MVMEEIMKNNLRKITYFFQNGRIDRLNSEKVFAKEMFYGYQYFRKNKFQTEIIEFSPQKTKLGKYFFLYIEKRLRNIFKLPLYWSFITNKANFRTIKKSNFLIFANNRMASSAIPMIIFSQMLGHKHKSLTFVMGLFSRTPKYKILEMIQKFYIILILKNIDIFIFLSVGEYKFANNNFKKYQHKFNFLPFAVDLDIWKIGNVSTKKYILFVGNDGHRDFKLAEKVSKMIPQKEFVFVSEEIDEKNLNNNSRIITGSWGNPKVTDIELREIYQNALITIIPLKNSLQPSGQSVTLQSMACGTPVLISHTDGFWDSKNFRDKENIFFAYDNSSESWVNQINSILDLPEKQISKIIFSGKKVIDQHYDLNLFSKKIHKLLED